MSYDDWKTSGNFHKCPHCGNYWTDSDGGCQYCEQCEHCDGRALVSAFDDNGFCPECFCHICGEDPVEDVNGHLYCCECVVIIKRELAIEDETK